MYLRIMQPRVNETGLWLNPYTKEASTEATKGTTLLVVFCVQNLSMCVCVCEYPVQAGIMESQLYTMPQCFCPTLVVELQQFCSVDAYMWQGCDCMLFYLYTPLSFSLSLSLSLLSPL